MEETVEAPTAVSSSRSVILIPLRARGDARAQLWDWSQFFLAEIGWPIFTADDGQEPFSRAGSLNAAADAAGDWDVALLGDADTIEDVDAVHRAASTGEVTIPWTTRLKLSRPGTQKAISRGPEAVAPRDRDRGDNSRGGGSIVVPRAAWDAVGGMDERHVGYGNEDLSFRAAIETLVAPIGHVDGTCLHLWHRPARYVGTDRAATPGNRELWERYKAAKGNRAAMEDLIAERAA
jgi:hypothetical protein